MKNFSGFLELFKNMCGNSHKMLTKIPKEITPVPLDAVSLEKKFK